MQQKQINLVTQKVVEAFSDRLPELTSIHPLGCREEHASDFEWYRNHSWPEFKELLPTKRFDPFEFNSLHPIAYHYFIPGVLLAVLQSFTSISDGIHFRVRDWIHTLVPLKNRASSLARDYLPLFTEQQKEAVADCLQLFNDWNQEFNGYYEADIERALNYTWLPSGR
jgi:hypothetical protein